MTAKNELIDFIANLTDDEVEILVNHFSELSSSLGESCLPCHQEQTLQTA